MEIKTDPNQKRVPDHSKRQMHKDRPNCNFSREPNNSTLWRAAHRIKTYKSGAGHVSDTTEVFTAAPYQVHSTSPDPGSLPASHRQQGDSRNKNSKREWCQAGDSLTFFFFFFSLNDATFPHLSTTCVMPLCRAMHNSLMTTVSELGHTAGFSIHTGRKGQTEAWNKWLESHPEGKQTEALLFTQQVWCSQ